MSTRKNAHPAALKTIRCAIYTRKSTEEGLPQEFNTLDAQRESGEACIWRGSSAPDIVTVSWIAFDKEQLGALESRLAPAAAFQLTRQSSQQGSSFAAPSDGFVYAHTGNAHSREVLLQYDRSMTTGRLGQNLSGMFPILKGQVAVVDTASGDNPAAQVFVYFFGPPR